MKQEEFFPEESFGTKCAKLIRDEERKTGARDYLTIARIIEEELARSFPKRQVRAQRDADFVCLVRACGIEPSQMTPDAERLAATSLAQIRKVAPQVDRAEFERRVRRYQQKFPGTPVTPRAIANNWALLGPNGNHPKQLDIYAEPKDREQRVRAYADAHGLDADEMASRPWSELPPFLREKLLEEKT